VELSLISGLIVKTSVELVSGALVVTVIEYCPLGRTGTSNAADKRPAASVVPVLSVVVPNLTENVDAGVKLAPEMVTGVPVVPLVGPMVMVPTAAAAGAATVKTPSKEKRDAADKTDRTLR
jgi:hypothetical protein